MRPYRSFTEAEIRALLTSVTRERRMAYLTLLYTGQRRSEIAALIVEDLTLGDKPEVRIRIETTKDKDKRAVALHPMLAQELRVFVPANGVPSDLVFPDFPSYDALRADLKRAGIERRDGLGRVVHFHSFRKTWQTLGVISGISQRVAQEVLGHSDPALTANVYTDLAAVGMHAEIEKLPWFGSAQLRALESQKTNVLGRFREIVGELVTLAKAVGAEGFATEMPGVSGGVEWLRTLSDNPKSLNQDTPYWALFAESGQGRVFVIVTIEARWFGSFPKLPSNTARSTCFPRPAHRVPRATPDRKSKNAPGFPEALAREMDRVKEGPEANRSRV